MASPESDKRAQLLSYVGNKIREDTTAFYRDWEGRSELAKFLLAAKVAMVLVTMKYLTTSISLAGHGEFRDAKGYAIDMLALTAITGATFVADRIRERRSDKNKPKS